MTCLRRYRQEIEPDRPWTFALPYDPKHPTYSFAVRAAADAMLGFCRKNIDPARVKGYFTAPWRKPVPADDQKTFEGIRLFAAAKRKHFA